MVNWTPEKEKDFFKYKYKDNLTYDDIAEKMAKKYNEEFTKGSLNSRHDAIKRGDEPYYKKLVKEVTGEAEEPKEPKAKPKPEPEPEEEKPKKKKTKAEGELEPSAYRWKYKEGAYDLQAIEIKATDGDSRTFSDVPVLVLVEEKSGGIMVPTEATVTVAGDDIRYVIGEKTSKWSDEKEREVAKIVIDFAKNDKTFEGEKFTKIEKATEKGDVVAGVIIEIKTEQKTDLFRDSTEELVVVPGEGGHALDWADKVKKIAVVKVEDQMVWTIDNRDAIGMRVEGVDTNGQTYVGTIQSLKKEDKESALKKREEMKEGREEAAWSEIVPVGFPQKRKDGRVEYVYIDPGKFVGEGEDADVTPGVVKTVRIPPSMGGK